MTKKNQAQVAAPSTQVAAPAETQVPAVNVRAPLKTNPKGSRGYATLYNISTPAQIADAVKTVCALMRAGSVKKLTARSRLGGKGDHALAPGKLTKVSDNMETLLTSALETELKSYDPATHKGRSEPVYISAEA